jgi:hypothetical protein
METVGQDAEHTAAPERGRGNASTRPSLVTPPLPHDGLLCAAERQVLVRVSRVSSRWAVRTTSRSGNHPSSKTTGDRPR